MEILKQRMYGEGYRHSSVDSSAPLILQTWVQIPSTPFMLLSIYIVQIVYLSFEMEFEKNEKTKRPGLAHFLKRMHGEM